MRTVVQIESTKAKARFAALASEAQAKDVAITRHGRIQAYVLSPERYARLAAVAHVGDDVMHKLDAGFEALVARMQSPVQEKVVDRLATEPLETILANDPSPKRARRRRAGK